MSNVFQKTLVPPGTPIERRRKQLGMLRSTPQVEAILGKLVTGVIPARNDHTGNRETATPTENLIHKMSETTTNNISDSQAMMQVLPDLKMVRQILISSILSPNDMVGTKLNVSMEELDIDTRLSAGFLEVIDSFITKEYKLDQLLPEILDDVLFEKGSRPMLVIPETAIDDIINSPKRVTMEALRVSRTVFQKDGHPRSLGLLGPLDSDLVNATRIHGISTEEIELYKALGLESGMTIDITKDSHQTKVDVTDAKGQTQTLFSVTDNPDIMKVPLLRKKIVTDRTAQLVGQNGLSGEITTKLLENTFYHHRQYHMSPVVPIRTLDTLEKPTVGHPLIMTLPPESVIPIHTPGNPADHVGYFVLLDRTGNPLNRAEYMNYYNDLSMNISNNRDMVSQFLATTRKNEVGRSQNSKTDQDEMVDMYTQMVENDLLQRLKNGVMGQDVKIARPTAIYRVMLSRALAKMHTQVLFVPASLVTYIAFEYNELGIGRSLLEETKILGGMRAMLMFSNTMAEIKNSVGRQKLKIELDPEDPEPSRTVEFLYSEFAKNRQSTFPIGASNPLDLVNFLQNAGVQLEVSGNEGYPVTNFGVEDVQSQRPEVNQALMDDFRKQQYNSFGVPPEAVDAASGSEFATTVVRNNLLFTKHVQQDQTKFCYALDDHIRKITLNSQILMDRLKAVYDKVMDKPATTVEEIQRKETTIALFINAIRLSLPSPDTVELEKQMDAFGVFNNALDEALKAYMNTEWLDPSIFGTLSEAVTPTVASIKAFFQRKWLRENNVLPELEAIVTWSEKDGAGLDLLKEQESHMDGLAKNLITYMQDWLKKKKVYDDQLAAAGGLSGGSSGGFGSDSGDTGDFGSTDMGAGTGDDTGLGSTDDLTGGNDDSEGSGDGSSETPEETPGTGGEDNEDTGSDDDKTDNGSENEPDVVEP